MKNIIKKISTGFAVAASMALLASSFVAVPAFADSNECDTNSPSLNVGVNCGKGQGMANNLVGQGGIVNTVINTMLFIVGILSVVMIIFAGIRYVTAHGDKGQVESAKNTLIYAIVGLIVAIVAYALVGWVTSLFAKN